MRAPAKTAALCSADGRHPFVVKASLAERWTQVLNEKGLVAQTVSADIWYHS